MPKKAVILSIGTELTTGRNLDTNSQYIAHKLFLLGINITSIKNLPDDHSIIKKHLSAAIKENDIVILTGGLGPTQDDITKDAVKDLLKLKTEYSSGIYKRIEMGFKERNFKTPRINRSQAIIFKDGLTLENRNGTAPGFIIQKIKSTIVLLPGPPSEMIPMLEQSVIPYLKERFRIKFFHKVFRITGIPESLVAEKLKNVDISVKKLKGDMSYLSNLNLIDVVISSGYNINKIKKISHEVTKLFKNNIYTDKWVTIYDIVSKLLLKKDLTLSIAESCTGGMLGKAITDIPGSSAYFKFGIICYSNQSKIKILNVKKSTLQKYGAVSPQTAKEMLKGLEEVIKTDVSISITGIAGPSGGSRDKPVGLVYIGIRIKNDTKIEKFVFKGSRERIRSFIVNKTFELLFQRLRQ